MSIEEVLHLGETYHWEAGQTVLWGLVNENTEALNPWIGIFQDAFQSYADVANISFEFVGVFGNEEDAEGLLDTTIRFEELKPGIAGNALPGYSLYPHFGGGDHDDGDITMSLNYFNSPSLSLPGSSTYQLILHEVGHSVGLKHPHEGGYGYGTSMVFEDYEYLWGLDSTIYTVMSYTNLATYNESKAIGPRGLDVLALQLIYGPPEGISSGSLTVSEGDSYFIKEGTQIDAYGQWNIIVHREFGPEFPGLTVVKLTKGLEIANDTVWLVGESFRINLDDYSLGFDDGSEQLYRLYRSAFDREADAGGAGYWLGRMDDGVTIDGVASAFVNSGEFNDSNFLTNLYDFALGRTPDEAGYNWWQEQIDEGLGYDQVLSSFSESIECIALYSIQTDAGLVYL